MERQKYIALCQQASYKTGSTGVWWKVRWNSDELVLFRGTRYVPVDYRFGFTDGSPRHIAILHDMKSNTEYQALLSEVEPVKEVT